MSCERRRGTPPGAVKTLATKRLVTLLHGTEVDDIEAGFELAATGATGLLLLPDLDSLHLSLSISAGSVAHREFDAMAI